jgi:hypothetical protein
LGSSRSRSAVFPRFRFPGLPYRGSRGSVVINGLPSRVIRPSSPRADKVVVSCALCGLPRSGARDGVLNPCRSRGGRSPLSRAGGLAFLYPPPRCAWFTRCSTSSCDLGCVAGCGALRIALIPLNCQLRASPRLCRVCLGILESKEFVDVCVLFRRRDG